MAAPATKVVVLDRGNNTTCTINLHEFKYRVAHFGSWPGGVPHGFAAISTWAVELEPQRLPSGDVEAIFSLEDNEATRTIWNYQFQLTYRMILREKELHLHVGVYNHSVDPFSFQLLLHAHFKVPDVRRCHITGLQGCNYIDHTRDGLLYQEQREVVTVAEWTDRVYQCTPREHLITNVVSGRKMRIQKFNLPDTVIWNPWARKAKEMDNFGNEEFPNMICVEAGHVSPVLLPTGTVFEATEILQVM